MWLRVLGSAAGGGFPQWNCGCPGCRAVRDGSRPCRARTQSSIAVSADYEKWFVFNASPDIRAQIESFPALHPVEARRSPINAVLLTDAELDHTFGLLLLRESDRLEIHATDAVHETLMEGTSLLGTLGAYTDIVWRVVKPGEDVQLGGELSYRAFDAPTQKQARFGVGGREGGVVGYRISDERTGGVLVYLPGSYELPESVLAEMEGCDCLLFDGTCWEDEEMVSLGLASKTSRDMGHLPMSGDDGSMKRLAPLEIRRKIYIHINNTNPVLIEDSPERQRVEESGFKVAEDGLEMEV